MPPITDPAALARVTSLYGASQAAGAQVQAAQAAVDDAATRATTLARALAAHDAEKPEPDPELADELSALLAANPAAAAAADWTGKVREAQAATAAALAAWEGKRAIIEQASQRVQGEQAQHELALSEARGGHEAAWAAFVNEAREAMTDELLHQWPAFYAAVLGPLDALNRARRIYSFEGVLGGRSRAVTVESNIAIRQPLPPTEFNPMPFTVAKLYPAAEHDAFPLSAFCARIEASRDTPKRASR